MVDAKHEFELQLDLWHDLGIYSRVDPKWL
jgi:hypothetical protein